MTELFTRGAAGAPDKRGEALMQQHADKLQRAKEESSIKAMRRLQPNLSPAIWILALQECDWEVDPANLMLKTFQTAKASELALVQSELKRLENGESSDDSKSEDRQQRKRKSKHKERKEKKSKHSKRETDKKERRHRHKKARRSESPEPATIKDQFGKYGIIGEQDLASKYSEFALWALDTQNIDIEVLPKAEEKELFRSYCEDYNTATLSHKKYYDLVDYQRKKEAERLKNRGSSDEDEPRALNDEAELKRQQIAERAQEREERLRDAYLELKHRAPGKAEDMREQELLRSQMALAYRVGDRDKATQIAERLKPDEVKEREAAKRFDPDNPGPP